MDITCADCGEVYDAETETADDHADGCPMIPLVEEMNDRD